MPIFTTSSKTALPALRGLSGLHTRDVSRAMLTARVPSHRDLQEPLDCHPQPLGCREGRRCAIINLDSEDPGRIGEWKGPDRDVAKCTLELEEDETKVCG